MNVTENQSYYLVTWIWSINNCRGEGSETFKFDNESSDDMNIAKTHAYEFVAEMRLEPCVNNVRFWVINHSAFDMET